jgi:cation diffusion facilitator family transporter
MVQRVPPVANQLRDERRVTLTGVVVNVGIAGASILVGVLCRSSAIIADGLHTVADLASDFTVLWGIHASKRPADNCHHYGHSRYETMTALFVGLSLAAAAAFVTAQSLVTLGEKHSGQMSWWPFVVAVSAIVLKETLYWVTRAVGRRYRNQALLASAWHHRSDAFSSVAAATGIGGAVLGGPRWCFLDHLTAVVLAAFLLVIAVRIVRHALSRLADRAPEPDVQERLRRTIAAIPGVRGFHAFRARQSGAGGMIEMDVHVEVDPELTVRQGHDIASRVESQLRHDMPDVTGIVVHIEPSAAEQEPTDRR